uniref:(northern house mosquito) hypothetical protein n=1 Tax=Culex pipiens TaxID=7175 RepID=A0A8D8D384_CULPI
MRSCQPPGGCGSLHATFVVITEIHFFQLWPRLIRNLALNTAIRNLALNTAMKPPTNRGAFCAAWPGKQSDCNILTDCGRLLRKFDPEFRTKKKKTLFERERTESKQTVKLSKKGADQGT